MNRLKFTTTSHVFGDCTQRFSVAYDGILTVKEFIDIVLKENQDEWGYIGIKCKGEIFGNPKCEYSKGKLLYEMTEDVLTKNIVDVTAQGGWTRVDYLIEI